MIILISKVMLNVWHLHRSIIAMFVQLHSLFSCGIVTVCALYQCKTQCGRISKPKSTVVGLPLVSSADGERGTPPMVAA